MKSIDVNIPSFPDSEIVELLLYDSPKSDLNQNTKILSSYISFNLKSERLNRSFLLKEGTSADHNIVNLHS